MSVMDMNSRMAMAEKLSVQQLQQAVQSGSLPAYIGIPLIEQKTKEKAQMAAAQGGQQKPPSVVASILQQADQQEQQERGIDELPSNLPMMEDEEVGMAGGGIIAFADRGRVNDPDEMTTMERIQEENPELYRRILLEQEGPPLGVNADTRDYSGNMQEGGGRSNRDPKVVSPGRAALIGQYRESRPEDRYKMPSSNEMPKNTILNPPNAFKNDPGYDPVPASPAGRFIQDKIVDAKGALNTYSLREKLYKQYSPAALGLSNATDAERIAAQEMLARIRDMSGPELRALEEQGRPPAMTAVESTSAPQPTAAPASQPTAAPQVSVPQTQSFPNEFPEEGASPSAGITAAPGAKSVNPVVPGAPRTAPQGGVSPSISRQISSVNPGAPASLSAAEDEASKSPRAAAALSMLDKYVAMLEKSGEDVGRQKKEALYMALIQGGLGMMGGTSPNAFANIAAGLLPATQAYQQAMRDIKKDDRARIEKLINAGLSKEKFAMELRKLGIEDKKADAMINYYNARAGAAGSGGGGKEDRLVRQGYERSGIEYDSLARRARTDMENALKNDSAYTGAKTQLAFAKSLKPEDRTRLEKIIRDKEAQYLPQIQDYRNKSRYFMKQAGMDLSSGGGGKEDVDLNQFFK